jgi:hypothetical protein
MPFELARGGRAWDAERVDPGLGPARMRRVVGDDTREGRAKLPEAACATEDHERQVMRGNHSVRAFVAHLLHEAREG